MAKPTRSDVLTLGLPPPAAASPGMLVERADAATGLIYYRAHGLSDGDALTLRLSSSTTTGAPATALPGGLAEGTVYEAVPATGDAFRVRLAGGSTKTSFSSAGSGRFSILLDPWPALDAAIDRAWTLIHARCTAHGGDVSAQIVTDACAALAVQLYIAATTAQDPAKKDSYAGLDALWERTYQPLLDAWLRGVPVRGATDATPSVSEGSTCFQVLGAAVPASTSWGTSSAELV